MNEASPEASFFALSESRVAALATARAAGLALAKLEERSFDGGEFKLRPLETVRDRTAIVFQSLAGTAQAPVSERLVRLLFLLGSLRDAGASRCIALIPYLAFARKDRRTQPRDPVYTRYIAELLEAAGTDHVIALDVHNPAALDNAFRIHVDHLSALPMMAEHFATRFHDANLVVASPDVGGVKRVQIFRELLQKRLGREIEIAFIEKRRTGDVVSGGTLVGMGRNSPAVIVLDDLCATGGTLIRAADICRDAGAVAVHVAVTHAPMRPGLDAVVDADSVSSVVVTDSVGAPGDFNGGHFRPDTKLTCLSLSPLLGLAVRRMLTGRPLTPLLTQWPLAPGD